MNNIFLKTSQNFKFEIKRRKHARIKTRFPQKSLKVGAVGGTMLAAAAIAKPTSDELAPDDNGVVVGKSNKKEVLYRKSKEWEYYYKIAY